VRKPTRVAVAAVTVVATAGSPAAATNHASGHWVSSGTPVAGQVAVYECETVVHGATRIKITCSTPFAATTSTALGSAAVAADSHPLPGGGTMGCAGTSARPTSSGGTITLSGCTEFTAFP
jgi:hypothetical protein